MIESIDRPSPESRDVGDLSAASVPAAISNAAFDTVGARPRSVPSTPEKVNSGGPWRVTAPRRSLGVRPISTGGN